MLRRCATFGSPTSNAWGSRLRMASSTSQGLLVAASTMTRAVSSVRKPSQRLMNSVFMLVTASCSWDLRCPRKLSTSSMKMMAGCSFQASVKTAVTSFCASPNHLLWSVDRRTLMKQASHSLASALASIVLPVPGGPYSSTPFTGLSRFPRWNSSGRRRGRITSSSRDCFTSSMPPMDAKSTLIWSGFTTSMAITSSYMLVWMADRPRRAAISFLRTAACFWDSRLGSRRRRPTDKMTKLNIALTA
mmetsp:Transcript_29846/g.57353  ORF Transcript_29846/g.57353 Transcript_29846/m.57353 type:complete len:246 (+) Transcript_29846:1053-1790(+)